MSVEEILTEIDSATILLVNELKQIRARLNFQIGIEDETNLFLPPGLLPAPLAAQDVLLAVIDAVPIATGTDFFAGQDLKPQKSVAQWRIYAVFATSSTLTIRKTTPTGTRPEVLGTLVGGEVSIVDVIVAQPETINFRHSDAGAITITDFLVTELPKMI